ncbi:endonuclease domain-containing protein [Roseimaritima sediminicola]|uniref:endonuclease domain-containing protein n=1 Tax=Roseimaritima sediminicola TaxID=2662066 RepID=UPI0012983A59|nr:endonuclease domain-containing protein [Roseimaritima sediminicola]
MSGRKTERARRLRERATKSENLLWGVLRARQLCGLKFRRQHDIGPFYVDFACVSKMLVVEIDGGYHDAIGQADLDREAFLREAGWDVIRFHDRDVERDAESVARGIARHLGLEYRFAKRAQTGSGIRRMKSARRNIGPPRA